MRLCLHCYGKNMDRDIGTWNKADPRRVSCAAGIGPGPPKYPKQIAFIPKIQGIWAIILGTLEVQSGFGSELAGLIHRCGSHGAPGVDPYRSSYSKVLRNSSLYIDGWMDGWIDRWIHG